MRISLEILAQLCSLAEQAGAEVMAVYGADFKSTTKSDNSPVTEADLRADTVIRQGLAQLFPSVMVVSEESLPLISPQPNALFLLVDPLDGTKEFVTRTDEFTINIALIENGIAIAGVVFAPARGELFYAGVSIGAFRRDSNGTKPIHIARYDSQLPLRVVSSRSHESARLLAWMKALRVEQEFEPIGSSLKFCRIAEGTADLYPRLGPTCLWDTAAAQCVLEQAGGQVTDLRGRPLRYEPRGDWLNPEFVAWGDKACLLLCASL